MPTRRVPPVRPSQPSSLTTNDWVFKKMLRITSWIHAGFGSRRPETEFKTPYLAEKENFIGFESPRTSHAHVYSLCECNQMEPLIHPDKSKVADMRRPVFFSQL